MLTKGPWQRNGSHVYGPDPERRLIAQMCYKGDAEDDGNVALVLAAPEMLAELRKVRNTFDQILTYGVIRDPDKRSALNECRKRLDLVIMHAEGRDKC